MVYQFDTVEQHHRQYLTFKYIAHLSLKSVPRDGNRVSAHTVYFCDGWLEQGLHDQPRR